MDCCHYIVAKVAMNRVDNFGDFAQIQTQEQRDLQIVVLYLSSIYSDRNWNNF